MMPAFSKDSKDKDSKTPKKTDTEKKVLKDSEKKVVGDQVYFETIIEDFENTKYTDKNIF